MSAISQPTQQIQKIRSNHNPRSNTSAGQKGANRGQEKTEKNHKERAVITQKKVEGICKSIVDKFIEDISKKVEEGLKNSDIEMSDEAKTKLVEYAGCITKEFLSIAFDELVQLIISWLCAETPKERKKKINDSEEEGPSPSDLPAQPDEYNPQTVASTISKIYLMKVCWKQIRNQFKEIKEIEDSRVISELTVALFNAYLREINQQQDGSAETSPVTTPGSTAAQTRYSRIVWHSPGSTHHSKTVAELCDSPSVPYHCSTDSRDILHEWAEAIGDWRELQTKRSGDRLD